MTSITVDTSRIDNEHVANYINGTDHRVKLGFRFALEMLTIPLPEFAERKPAGRPSRAAQLMKMADADSGTIHTYHDEKKFAPRRP